MKIRFYQMQKLAKQILHRILQHQLQIIHLMSFIQGILLNMIRETWTVFESGRPLKVNGGAKVMATFTVHD